MTTMTDDISARIAAVEADIRSINTQLAELNANQRQMREELQAERAQRQAELQADRAQRQAELQELRAEFRADIRATNSRIDRVFWAIIAFGSIAVVSLVAIIANLILTIVNAN